VRHFSARIHRPCVVCAIGSVLNVNYWSAYGICTGSKPLSRQVDVNMPKPLLFKHSR